MSGCRDIGFGHVERVVALFAGLQECCDDRQARLARRYVGLSGSYGSKSVRACDFRCF